MKKKTRRSTHDPNEPTTAEHQLTWLMTQLFRSDLRWLGRSLVKILRIKRHDHPIQAEQGPKQGVLLPTGPYVITRQRHLGDLMLWVPRRIDSFLIDDLTGGYGYSHSTFDTGEIDAPTRKPVMLEITVGQTLMYKFQDQYGPRHFARVPLSKTGIDVNQFVACAKSRVGEQYDNLDAITLGKINDPAKEVCSGLAADCLPEEALEQIAAARETGKLHKSSVSVHSKVGSAVTRIFISPNGLAEYYGAPPGGKLTAPDTVIKPRPLVAHEGKLAGVVSHHMALRLAAGVFAVALLVLILKHPQHHHPIQS